MKQGKKRVVLVAAIGTSPAVLTETVWAMAHGPGHVVPDQIEVVTTRTGKEEIEKKLLSGAPTVWEAMMGALKADKVKIPEGLRFGKSCIVVIPDDSGNEAEDLRSPSDNMRAADVMLATIRKHTENPETVVYASIAGGRKSMSALMFSCMSLLGRTGDRVTHVLTTPEPINMVSVKDKSEFYFPKKGHTYEHGHREERKKVEAGKIAIEMFDVPFVRMRGWYQDRFGSIPPSYGTLVNAVQNEAPPAENQLPMIEMDAVTGKVKIDDVDCPLSDGVRMLMYLCLKGCFDKGERLTVLDKIRQFDPEQRKACPKWVRAYLGTSRSHGKGQCGKGYDQETLSCVAHELRKGLSSRLRKDAALMVCPLRSQTGSYPKNRICIRNEESVSLLSELVKSE